MVSLDFESDNFDQIRPSLTYMLEIKIFVDNPKPEKYLDLETITFVGFVYLLMANDVEQSETTSKDSISLLF